MNSDVSRVVKDTPRLIRAGGSSITNPVPLFTPRPGGSSSRRRWRRVESAGASPTWPRCPSTAWWNSARASRRAPSCWTWRRPRCPRWSVRSETPFRGRRAGPRKTDMRLGWVVGLVTPQPWIISSPLESWSIACRSLVKSKPTRIKTRWPSETGFKTAGFGKCCCHG